MELLDDKIIRQKQARQRDEWFFDHFAEAKRDWQRFYTLTEEEEKAILDFWKPYEFAVHNDMRNQWTFSRASGKFDPSYIGFGTQLYLLNSFWNHHSFSFFRDRINQPYLFSAVKTPERIVYNQYGFFHDASQRLLSLEEAARIVKEALIKNADLELQYNQERNELTEKFEVNASETEIIEALQKAGKDFVIQKSIIDHDSLSMLCHGAKFKIQLSSLSWHGQLYYNGAILQMSKGLDGFEWVKNQTMVCRIHSDGALEEKAIDRNGCTYYGHPVSGVQFADVRLPDFERVIAACERIHGQMPQQRMLLIDFTIDRQGGIVLREINSPGNAETLQLCGINPYHDIDTAKEIFDVYLKEKFFVLNQNSDFIFREFSDHVSIIKYKGLSTVCEIPETLQGKSVWRIYGGAFSGSQIRAVKLKKTIATEADTFKGIKGNVIIDRY